MDVVLQRLLEIETAAQAGRDALLVQLQSFAGEGQSNRDLIVRQLQILEAGAQQNRDALISQLQHLAGEGQGNRDLIVQQLQVLEAGAQKNRDALISHLQPLAGEGQANRDQIIQQLQALETQGQASRDTIVSLLNEGIGAQLLGLAGESQVNRDLILRQLQTLEARTQENRDTIVGLLNEGIGAQLLGLAGESQVNRDLTLRQLQTLEARTQENRDIIIGHLQSGQKDAQVRARDLMLGLERIETRLARWEEHDNAASDRLTAAVFQIGRRLFLSASGPRLIRHGAVGRTASGPIESAVPDELASHAAIERVRRSADGRVFASLDSVGVSASSLLDALIAADIAPGASVACLHRPAPGDDPREEARQIFGAIGKPSGIELLDDKDGPIALAWGNARTTRALFAVIWREEDFEARRHLATEWPTKWGETLCPIIAVPDKLSMSNATWLAKAAGVIKAHHPGVRSFGIAWPRTALQATVKAARIATQANEAMKDVGARLGVQIVRGAIAPSDTPAVLALARQTGATLDLTVLARGEPGPNLCAYQDLSAYRPAEFDMRLIEQCNTETGGKEGPQVCVARRQVRDADALSGRGAFAPRFARARIANRLDLVLDRAAAERVRERVRREPVSGQGLWEQHVFFNWAPPTGDWAFAIAVEANEMFDPGGPAPLAFEELETQGILEKPLAFLEHASASAREARPVNATDNVELQVSVHAYLRDQRSEPTPDSAYITTWLPPKLGRTLELGAGYGALARLIISRAKTYAALDLTQEQADALTELGATGIVGDIHDIPFPDDSFDTLIADNVIEHASDPVQALREISRVLAPEGRAYLVMPLDYFTAEFHNESHHWKADEASIRSAIALAGLEARRFRSAHLSEFGMEAGSNPSCGGFTSFWELVRTSRAK